MGKEHAKEPKNIPEEKFIRVCKAHIPDSHWPAYQAEVVTIKGSSVVSRQFVDKPDTKVMAFAKAYGFIDDTE